MAGIKGKSGGKRAGAGAKKLPNELKRDNIIRFMIGHVIISIMNLELKIYVILRIICVGVIEKSVRINK